MICFSHVLYTAILDPHSPPESHSIQQNWSHALCIARPKPHYPPGFQQQQQKSNHWSQPWWRLHRWPSWRARARESGHSHSTAWMQGGALPPITPYNVVFGRADPAPLLGNTVELALMADADEPAPKVWAWESWPTLTGYNTWKSGPHALTGQHSGTGSGGMGMGSWLRAWEQELTLPPADCGIRWPS